MKPKPQSANFLKIKHVTTMEASGDHELFVVTSAHGWKTNKCAISRPRVSLSSKLAKRRTINRFNSWNEKYGPNGLGLYWTANVKARRSTIVLDSMNWHFHAVGQSWEWKHPKQMDYVIGRDYHSDAEDATNWGEFTSLDFANPAYQEIYVSTAKKQLLATKADGLLLDWWHNRHEEETGCYRSKIKKARRSLAEKLRAALGENYIIMGNVNWDYDDTTVDVINGVFLELYKPIDRNDETYTARELAKIEKSLLFYQRNLRAPKLIALEGRRKTLDLSDSDRNSSENRKMAKLLTAMAVVIPENGYIHYADNAFDDLSTQNLDFINYDFYSFDIGRATNVMRKIKKGAGFKEHEKGVIAYNITNRDVPFNHDGIDFVIKAKSGLFCKTASGKTSCLSID